MEYCLVDPGQWIERVRPLLAENWAETGFDFELAPDAARYGALHDARALFALAAFDGGEVVGYCTVGLGRHLFNPAVVVASHDALFVARRWRGGTVAARLIAEAEAEAKRRGAALFCWHTRAGTGMAQMLERRGYRPADVVVMKEI